MGAWLRKIPLTEIAEKGFFVTLKAGEVLIVPEFYMVMEACLGGEVGGSGSDMVSYPFLLESRTAKFVNEVWSNGYVTGNWQLAVNNYFVWLVMSSMFFDCRFWIILV